MNEYEEKFMKAFDKLCKTRNAWQAWTDFVNAAAISISNIVDTDNYEQREAAYMSIASGYTSEEMKNVARLMAITVMALEKDPEQDFLGSMFMKLSLGSNLHGQFFTPYHVCQLMAGIEKEAIVEEIKQNGHMTVNEPACGAGANVIAIRAEVVKAGYDPDKRMFAIAQDIERNSAMMCYIQLSFLNVPGYVVVGDTLSSAIKGNILAPKFPAEYEVWTLPATLMNLEWLIRRKISGQRNKLRTADV